MLNSPVCVPVTRITLQKRSGSAGSLLCERCRNHLEVGKGVINPEDPDSSEIVGLIERADDLV